MNAVPEPRSPSLAARAPGALRADGGRDAFEQALARRSPPHASDATARPTGAPSRAGLAEESEEGSPDLFGLALPGAGSEALAGSRGDPLAGPGATPDPFAALPAATRMTLAAALSGASAAAGAAPVASVSGASASGTALGADPLMAMMPDPLLAEGMPSQGVAGRDAGVPAEPAAGASTRATAVPGHEPAGARSRASTQSQAQTREPTVADGLFMPSRLPEMSIATAVPAPAAGAAGSAVDAAALVARLIGQVPLSGSADDAIRMLFPAGSGPIEQIVLNREAGQLNLVVSATPGAREAVSRGVLDLERRLRDRGLPVGAVRLADREAAAD
ncbi:MAG: hypothetical protein WCG13_03570 [Burkholderiales bacterium]